MAIGRSRLAKPALKQLPGAVLFLGLILSGCGGPTEADVLVEDARRLALSDDGAGGAEYAVRATATLYPTFTVVPTVGVVTSVPVPTATTVGFLPPTAAPTPMPTPHVDLHTPVPATLLPVPVVVSSSGGVYGALLGQTFFGMHSVPEVGEPMPAWPEGEEVFLVRTTRYLVWYLMFDHGRIADSKVERCLMRVMMAVGPVDQRREHVVHQEPVDIEIDLGQEGNATQVILGLGNPLPGDLWTPGDYTVELWDPEDRVVAQWEFKVG